MGTYSKKGFLLPKKKLNILIDILKNYGKIIAPVQGEKWLRMENVEGVDDISFSGLSWYSFKKEVFPQKQIIFEFKGTSIIKPKKNEIENKVLFGLRMCDLNSFKINDKLFLEQDSPHENYKNNREKITLVGLWCNSQVDNYCFCSSFDLEHYYDICLFEVDRNGEECFHIKANSKKGEEILFKLNQINGMLPLEEYKAQVPDCRTKLNETNIERFFDRNDVWEKESEKCLSCGDCTSLCPTCLCFDIKDKVNLDLISGVRVAQWDSCMFKDFTAVAGGGIARDKRVDRLKHRIFHKLTYFPKKFDGASMCTGCGRCIRGCPTKIHWVSGVNGLVKEEEKSR